jgi:hypothetical protein
MKKTMKKIDKDDMKQLIQAIKQFSKEIKDDEVSNASSKITTKELMFYYLAQHTILETRVTKIETTQKNLCYFLGVALTMISLTIGILRV